ncbi:MAG: hypothetical protein AAFU70_04160, partial [Planctomycetota bacterium]
MRRRLARRASTDLGFAEDAEYLRRMPVEIGARTPTLEPIPLARGAGGNRFPITRTEAQCHHALDGRDVLGRDRRRFVVVRLGLDGRALKGLGVATQAGEGGDGRRAHAGRGEEPPPRDALARSLFVDLHAA